MSHTIIMKNKKISGIYQITNLINQKFYIGCSRDIAKRWKQHIRGSSNAYLKNSLNKYGKESFEFKVIEECKIEMLYIREKFWMEKLKPVYNLIESIEGCYQHSEETIEKLSKLNKGKKLSLETRKKISKALKGKYVGENSNHWKGGISLDQKAYEQTPERQAWKKAYEQTPERKAYKKEWEQTTERKAYKKEYRLKNAEKIKEYQKAYRLRKRA